MRKIKKPRGSGADVVRPTYDSMASCSSALKIPLALLKLAKRSGCSAFNGAGRVRLAPFLEWVFSRDDSVTDWTTHGKKFDALNRELEFKAKSGAVIDRDVVETGIRACMAVLFSELDKKFLNELPPSLKGLGEMEVRAVNERAIQEFRKRITKALLELTDDPGVSQAEDGKP